MAHVEEAPSVRRRRELRRYQQGAFVLAALALVGGGALLPSGDELLLIHVKNRDIAKARELLADASSAHVSSAASVVAHGELFQMEGRVDEALVELEAFAEAHPRDVNAWKRLTRMYADAQRLADQVRSASHVYTLEPSEDVARRLVTLHRWTGDEAAEANVLRDLVAKGQATPDEHVRSARLDAAFGRTTRAFDALERLRRREPGAFDYATMELYASLMLDTRGPAQLAGPIQVLPVVTQQPDALPRLARVLTTWGRPDAAVALVDVPLGVAPSAERLTLRARVAQGTPEAGRVARELAERDARQPLPDEALKAFVDLALSVRAYEAVSAVLANRAQTGSRSPDSVETELTALVIGHAVSHDARAQAQALIARVGDGSLKESPMLAVELAVERADKSSAEAWIAAIDARPDTTPEQIAALARFESQLGQPDRAFDRLAALLASGKAPDWVASDFAALAVATSRSHDALTVLASAASPVARSAWVRLAVTTDRVELVRAWLLDGRQKPVDASALRDTYFLLADRHETNLAVAAAERLFAVRGTADDGLLLGRALLADGRPLEAVARLRHASTSDVDALLAYDSALLAALQQGADVATEVRRVFHERLVAPRMPADHRSTLVEGLFAAGERATIVNEIAALAATDIARWLSPLVESAKAAKQSAKAVEVIATALVSADVGRPGASQPAGTVVARTDLVRALMELDAPDEVLLPELERMAYTLGENWVFAYDERLVRGARTSEQVRLWTHVGNQKGADAQRRRSAASRLIELGGTRQAIDIYRSLARRAGPTEPDVLQLLYLWGPTISASQIAWLTERLTAASVDDQPLWMDHILRAGREPGARAIVQSLPELPNGASAAFVGAWLNAHQTIGDKQQVRAAVSQVLAAQSMSAEALRLAGRASLTRGLRDLAVEAFAKLVDHAPNDLEALRWLGVLAFYDGRTDAARTWLNAYLRAGGAEPEPLYQLGELAMADRERDLARFFFGQALDQLELLGADRTYLPLLANVLVRLDRRERATETFERALEEDQTRDHVRADYVSALMQWDDFGRAETVLQRRPTPPSASTPEAEDDGGGKRLDLLRVQLLTHGGRYIEVLRLLDNLGERYPDDPDVLIARAGFDAERGRLADADRGYQLAGRNAPQREDIERLLRFRARQQAPRAALERETRTISGGWAERSERLLAEGRLRARTPFSFTFQQLDVTVPRSPQPDGSFASRESHVSRFEASTTVPMAGTTRLTGSLFGTSGGVGFGSAFSRDDLRGRTEVGAEINRPFWEFLEGVTDDGRRDRIAIQRQWRLRPDTAAWSEAAWNRYSLGSGFQAYSTALTFGFIRTIRRASPSITLQYGLDKERRLDAPVVPTEGLPTRAIALSSREVHLFGGVSRFNIRNLGEVEATAGYTLDRLGGRGSFLTGRLTPPIDARVGLALWVDRRRFVLATKQQVLRSGLQVMVRF